VLTRFIYRWIVAPMRLKSHYARLFRAKGYRVLELPFKPVGAPYYEDLAREAETHHDAFYNHKHSYYNYDLVISNVLDRPEIIPLSFDLIKELLSSEKLNVL
jgi:hypothetical protein